MAQIIKRNKFQIWCDVIVALFIREIRTGFDDKLGISWSVISPVAFIFILSLVRGRLTGGDIHGVPIFTFIASGLILFQFFMETLSGVNTAYKGGKSLYGFRQVQPLSAVIAKSIFSLMTKLAAIALIVLIMYFLQMELQIKKPLEALGIILCMWLIGVGIGLTVAVFSQFVPEVSKLFSMATRPLLFVSCIIFSVHEVPHAYWGYLSWNPLANGAELLRNTMYPDYSPGPMTFQYLFEFTIYSMAAGLFSYQALWKRALSNGGG